ncbi:8620_t:CDS:1 [Paraglomus occultum]|uniref:8620_t:CDS:1 n=1 Tax=Paraglomus occultum TaxID=144539 RepID=A0A9N9GAC8_9GLOM|nr:8620_t:CDS:1 [Paraglomus occultum]
MQDLRQRVNVGERDAGRNNNYSGIGMDCDPGLTLQQKSRDQMQTVDRISNHNGKDISEADINAFPVTPTLQLSSSSSSQYLCPSLSRIADECIDDDVQSPSASSTQSSEDSVEITKPSRNRFGSVTGTLVRRQPVRNVISAYASHPYPQQRRRKASVKICKK